MNCPSVHIPGSRFPLMAQLMTIEQMSKMCACTLMLLFKGSDNTCSTWIFGLEHVNRTCLFITYPPPHPPNPLLNQTDLLSQFEKQTKKPLRHDDCIVCCLKTKMCEHSTKI